MEKQQANPLGYEPIGKLLRAFALPAVISMLINAIYNIVDQIFIGQGVGYLGNAATTIAFPIVTIILAVGTTIGAADHLLTHFIDPPPFLLCECQQKDQALQKQ